MKKFESIKDFECNRINKLAMKNLIGGNAPNETAAGSRNVTNSCGQVLFHITWTSDHNMGVGSNGVMMVDYCGEVASYVS